MQFKNPAHPQICEKCGTEFSCGDRVDQPCWCNTLPPIPNPNLLTKCMCPTCLQDFIASFTKD